MTMTKDIQRTARDDVSIGAEAVDAIIATNDLSKLTAPQRLAYYGAKCHALGLKPELRPFEYLTLQGKTVLYANKGCAEQLRAVWKVTITVQPYREGDLYCVKATATLPNGRSDEDIGYADIRNLKGDDLGKAIMKATTRAKRRVTLSICGAGVPDEEDVLEVDGAQKITEAKLDARPVLAPKDELVSVQPETPKPGEPITLEYVDDSPPVGAQFHELAADITGITSRSGAKKNGEPWTLYTIETNAGVKFGTFSETCAAVARAIKDRGDMAFFLYCETDKGGNRVLELRPVKEATDGI